MVLQYAVGGAILPFVTLLLRDRGLTVSDISVVLMVGAAALLVAPFFWGMLADRYVPLNHLFGWMNGIGALALALFTGQHERVGAVLAFTLFYACFQPAPMLVNVIALRHLRDPHRDFGLLRAWGSLGWVLPSLPVFVWLVLGRTRNLELVVWLSMGFSVAMVAAAFRLPATPPGGARRGGGPTYVPALKRLLGNPRYLVLLASYLLVSASFAIQAFYSPPRLEDLGMSRPWIGLAQSVGVFWEIGLFFGRDAIIRWLGERQAVAAGCAALLLRQLLFAFADNLWVLAASYILVGTTVVLYHIGVSLMVEHIAGREVKSTAQTLLTLCSSGVGPILANLAVGRLTAGGGGLGRVFLFSATLTALASLLLWRWGGIRETAGAGTASVASRCE